jgi:hypothetical protein
MSDKDVIPFERKKDEKKEKISKEQLDLEYQLALNQRKKQEEEEKRKAKNERVKREYNLKK